MSQVAPTRQRDAPLGIALAFTSALAVLELVGGFAAQSLALLTDAAHVFMDVLALGIAVAAALQARRPANDRQSYGFARFEIIAALVNALLLVGVTAVIVFEAVHRLAAPELPRGNIMAIVAGVGFIVNVAIGLTLLRTSRRNLNVKSALFHVVSDAIGAFAVAIGGLVVLATRSAWIDPLLSLLVAAIILIGVARIVREATDVLLESAPSDAPIPAVRAAVRSLPGIVGVHDLHVWTIGSGEHVLTAHVLLEDKSISEATAVLTMIESCLRDDFNIQHVTVQFECEACAQSERIVCTRSDETG